MEVYCFVSTVAYVPVEPNSSGAKVCLFCETAKMSDVITIC